MVKRVFLFIIGICLLYGIWNILANPAYAANFIVDYAVDYSISNEGKTSVTQQVSLLNQQTNLYAQQYSIVIDSNKITNITAFDKKGSIIPQVTQEENRTSITLNFNEEVVGQGNILKFTLKYDDENIAKKNGTIWEVSIPGIENDEGLGEYTLKLHVPASFGKPAYLVPEPTQPLTWTKNQLINGGVSAAFGNKQVYELSLSYFIENPKQSPIITEVALPPSTAYQNVILQSITPEPLEIVTDEDSNWLARYKLAPSSNLTIRANLFTEVFLHPRNVQYPISSETLAQYTQPTNFWDTHHSEITAIAQEADTPREIYDFVIAKLNYDYSRVNSEITRKGAVSALETPDNSVCMEFTDLFIAIARAAGIPAREAIGYAYTTNPKLRPLSLVSDVLHAWPEYYDDVQKRWIPVDPTWGDTTGGINYFDKLDFNHIVFAYNGVRDDYPYPAGFYREIGKTGKDIEVRFYDGALPMSEPQTHVSFQVPSHVPAGLAQNGSVLIKNTANTAAEGVSINVESQQFGIHHAQHSLVVPPYGTVNVPMTLREPNYFLSGKGSITATVNGAVYKQQIDITPAYYIIAPIIIGIIWLSITIIIIMRKIIVWKSIK